MPRPPRIRVRGGFYHVTLRGNHAQPVIFQSADRVALDGIVGATIARCGARVHAYCWMTNHIHLLVQVEEIPLGRVILRIAGRYARTVQSRLDTTGHLFERRYHSVLVDADAYLRPETPGWVTTEFALRMLHPRRRAAVEAYCA